MKIRGISGNKLDSKKTGTLKDLDILSNVRVQYGTVSTNKPKSIYILLKSWSNLTPIADKDKLESVRAKLNKNMRQYVNNVIDRELFNENKTNLSYFY